jgi:hypothetical protein
MFKISSHGPFGYLKYKLWPKEAPIIKLPIWFSTIKNQESPIFTFVQMVCNILLEISWQGLQRCFGLHFNQRFAQKDMGLQSCKSLKFGNFGTSNLGVPTQNDIWVQALWPSTKNTIMGKVVVSPSIGHGESCESVYAHGSSMHQECYNYALNNLLFGLCSPMWIINMLVIFPTPYPKSLARLFYLQSVAR